MFSFVIQTYNYSPEDLNNLPNKETIVLSVSHVYEGNIE